MNASSCRKLGYNRKVVHCNDYTQGMEFAASAIILSMLLILL
jgi:hypothetical protein